MPKLRVLSGPDIVKIFQHFGFSIAKQEGSHLKLRRITLSGQNQTLTIPNHNELDKGTLRAIIRQAAAYVSEVELRPFFYTE